MTARYLIGYAGVCLGVVAFFTLFDGNWVKKRKSSDILSFEGMSRRVTLPIMCFTGAVSLMSGMVLWLVDLMR